MTRPPMLRFVAGEHDAGAIVADLDALAEFGAFVEGTSRSGKTNVVRVFLEQTYGLVQHIVLDVEGEYATLRSAERPYLVVGKGRDVAIAADSAAVRRLVLALVEKGVSVIIDLSEHDTGEQHLIVAAVCDALVSLPENHPGGAAVVLEELQEFAPEGGGKNTALSSVRRLSKRGLKRGFFIIGASQRVSDVSKGIVTQLKTKLIGGTDHKDAPRALEELGLPSRDRQAVTDLAQGDFWVKGPAFARHAQHVRVPRSVTAPVKRRRGDPPAPAAEAPAEIAALAKALAAAVATEESTAEPSTIAIAPAYGVGSSAAATLTRIGSRVDMSHLVQRARDEARFDEAERHERYRQVLRAGAEHAIAETRTAANVVADQFRDIIAGFEAVLAGVDEGWIKPVPPDPEDRPQSLTMAESLILPISHTRRPMPEHLPTLRVTRAPASNGKLPRSQQGILDAIAFFNAIGIATPTKGQVAALAGLSEKVSTWRIHLGALRKGYVDDVGAEGLALTAIGKPLASATDAPQSRAELHALWRSRLESDAQRRMLDALLAVYPRALTREELGRRAGVDHTVSTMRIHVGRLRKFSLIEDAGDGFRASSLLSPEGLP